MAPDRSQLQSMFKKEKETFKEYAQRWRELAAEVQPPLSEKEVVTMFIDTLQAPYYEKMIGSMCANFSDIVLIGERIENGLRSGRLTHEATGGGSVRKPPFDPKKKEGEAHHVAFEARRPSANFATPNKQPYYPSPYRPPINPYPHFAPAFRAPQQQMTFHPPPPQATMPPTTYPPHNNPPWNLNRGLNQNPLHTQRKNNFPNQRSPHFDPIPMTYTELLPHLIQNSLVVPFSVKPVEPPYPVGYDQNAKCDYHAGAVGHATENCRALKNKVQQLIDSKWLNFKENGPNIGTNPLLSHGGTSVNADG